MRRRLAALLGLFGAMPGARCQTPELSLPIACTVGETCFVQQYVDVDPGPGSKDYRCGGATYDGHKGVDFRVLSVKAAEAGVPVLAAAPGRVKAGRDGMDDRLVRTDQDRKAVAGRECGNGVVIDHGGGWETQYCHMRRGSVIVRQGDQVSAGTELGLVGFSGDAAFAHVHLSVRHNEGVIDPFLGVDPVSGTCQTGAQPASGLWSPSATRALAYQDAAIIQTGFADRRVEPADLEQGGFSEPHPASPALVFFARLINLRPQDSLRFTVQGPGGFIVTSESESMDRAKAHYVGVAGKKLSATRWPAGVYEGRVQVIRAGSILRESKAAFRLQ